MKKKNIKAIRLFGFLVHRPQMVFRVRKVATPVLCKKAQRVRAAALGQPGYAELVRAMELLETRDPIDNWVNGLGQAPCGFSQFW